MTNKQVAAGYMEMAISEALGDTRLLFFKRSIEYSRREGGIGFVGGGFGRNISREEMGRMTVLRALLNFRDTFGYFISTPLSVAGYYLSIYVKLFIRLFCKPHDY